MVMELVGHVQWGPMWHLHGFLRSLALTNQEYRIGVLGLDTAVYVDPPIADIPTPSNYTHQKRHFYTDLNTDEMREFPMGALPGILQHCKRNLRMLMRTTLFGIDDNTSLDLTQIYINQNPDCKINQRAYQSIAPEALFLKLSQRHSPNSILVEGDAGSGKCTFFRQYAHTSCKDLINCHNRGPAFPCEGHPWKLVTYIAAGSMSESQEAAIRDSLQCDEKLKDQVMAMIEEDGEGVLIMNDGIDELRKQTEKESLRQYTISRQKDGTPMILVSSRVRLCPIKGKFFDRSLLIKGFSLDQGVNYMEKYLRVHHHLTTHPVLDHISGKREHFEWVLMNPLRIHVLSELTGRGAITLEDVKSLTTVKLLKVLEEFLVKRDQKCRGADTAEEHSKLFYRLCLECLLKDERRISEVAIPNTSPYLVFLSKHTELDEYAKENNFYMFAHEVLFEFMAIQGLVECLKMEPVYKNAIMLFICAEPNMRNALHLLCGYISAYEPTLVPDLVFLIQACAVLQTEVEVCEKTRLTKKLLTFPTLIRETVSRDLLSKGLTTQQARTIDKTYKKIQKAFKQNAKSLQQAGWFGNGLPVDLYFAQGALHEFLTGCFRQCAPSLQESLYMQTIHKLLPCIRYNLVHQDGTERTYDQFVFPTSNGRWGVVNIHTATSYSTSVIVAAWCPSDIAHTPAELYTQQAPRTCTHRVYIDLETPASLWGVQPPEMLTHEQWVSALSQVLIRRVDLINIITDTTLCVSPLSGLLTALQDIIRPRHRLAQGIYVWYGQVKEKLLADFCEWTYTVNLTVRLCFAQVLLCENCDEDYVTHLHQRVQDVMRVEQPPTYIRPDGEIFNVPPHAWKMFGVSVRKRRDRQHLYK